MALPDLGRSVNTVRKIWGVSLVSEKVDDSAEITAGQVATRILDAQGNVVYSVCNATTVPAGIFFGHKTSYFYVPIVNENVTFDVDTKNLEHAVIKSGSVKVTNSAGTVVYAETTDYNINYTNGQITRVSGGAIPTGATVLVTYKYRDPNESGVDQTLGSNKLTILKGVGEIGTLVYDTSKTINVNDNIRSNADGLLSTDTGLTGPVIGVVSKAPTADDPELIVELK